MTAIEIVAELACLGARVFVDSVGLGIEAPAGVVGADLMDEVRACKPVLLEHLKSEGLDFIRQWPVVGSKRSGTDSDWRSWSPACRRGWARSMLGMLEDELGTSIPEELTAKVLWLRELVASTPTSDVDFDDQNRSPADHGVQTEDD